MYNPFTVDVVTCDTTRLYAAINAGDLIAAKIAIMPTFDVEPHSVMHALSKLEVFGEPFCYKLITMLLRRGADIKATNHPYDNCLAKALRGLASERIASKLMTHGGELICSTREEIERVEYSRELIDSMLLRHECETYAAIDTSFYEPGANVTDAIANFMYVMVGEHSEAANFMRVAIDEDAAASDGDAVSSE